MKAKILKSAALSGTLLVLIYTAIISTADGITKLLAGGYAAPQLYAISGGLVVLFTLLADRVKPQSEGMRTTKPGAMALRAAMTVLSTICYFYSFRLLPFAEVFIFIGMVPIFAGVFSGLILREHVRLQVWLALAAGFIGVLMIFPEGLHSVTLGHAVALVASLSGTLSMVMARYIGKFESNSLAQVFYPNLAIMICMGAALPFVFKPMPITDVLWAVAYAFCLFGARWILVVSLRKLPAYAVTPLMNMQFVWMVLIGAIFFGEVPGTYIYFGVAVVIAAGLYLIYDQNSPRARRGWDRYMSRISDAGESLVEEPVPARATSR
ncbi:DMT family transporter [Pseudooceanicola sp. 502str34]